MKTAKLLAFFSVLALLLVTSAYADPNVTTLVPAANSVFNVSNVIEISANAVSNVSIDKVLANITLPNGTVQQLSLTNLTGNKFNNSFTIPGDFGLFNVTFIANDTEGKLNNTQRTNFTVNDVVPPAVIAPLPAPSSVFTTGTTIDVAVNVTDDTVFVTQVIANITHPNGVLSILPLNLSNGTKFNNSFLIPGSPLGVYNVTFIANDTSNNVNKSVTTNFTVTDGSVPVIAPIVCTPAAPPLNSSTRCFGNATDNINVTTVRANVTFPNGSVVAQSLVNGTFNFSTIFIPGRYNISFEALDAAGNQGLRLGSFTTVNSTPLFVLNVTNKTFPEDTNLTVNFSNIFVDLDGHNISINVTTSTLNITVIITNRTNITFVPDKNFFGNRTINLTALDQDGTTLSNNFNIHVVSVNDLPVITQPIINNTVENTPPFIVDLTPFESDVESSTTNLTYSVLSFDTAFFSNVLVADANNDLISVALLPNVNGPADFVVRLTDFHGGFVQGNVTMNISSINGVPNFLSPIVNQTVIEDTLKSLNISSLLNDSDNLTSELTITTNSSRVQVNGKVLILNYTDQTLTNETVRVNVSDGLSQSSTIFKVNVTFVNDRPVVNATTVSALEDSATAILLNLTNVTSDEETTPSTLLSYTVASVNPAQAICALSGLQLLQVTPAKNFSGLASCNVTATDVGPLASNPTLITINITPVADPLVFGITPIPNQVVNQSSSRLLNLTPFWVNVDNDPLTFTATNTANFTVTIVNGVANITAQPNFLGTNIIVFNSSDGPTSGLSNTITLSIQNNNLNGPVWSALPIVGFLEDGSNNSLDLDNFVSDIDTPDSALTFSKSGDQRINVAIDAAHVATFSAQANYCNQTNLASVVLTASDGVTIANQAVQVNVTCVNDPPSIVLNTPTAGSTINSNTPTLTWNATDVENNPLSFSVFLDTSVTPSAPLGTITANSLTTSTLSNQQQYFWKVIASDGTNSTNSTTFSFTVVTNTAPSLSQQTPASTTLSGVETGTSLSFSVNATDIDTTALTASANLTFGSTVVSSQPPTAVANATIFTFTPTFANIGLNTVNIAISDGVNTPVVRSWTVNVVAFNNPPTLSITNPTPVNEDDPAFTLNLAPFANDQEDSTSQMSFALTGETNVPVVDCALSSQTVTCTPQPNQFGNSTVTINVTDSGGKSVVDNFTVVVNQVNDPPTITTADPLYTNPAIAPNKSFTFRVFASDPDTSNVNFTWSLDGVPIPSANTQVFAGNTGSAYIFSNGSVGKTFTLRADVTDGTSTVTQTWTIQVTDKIQLSQFNGNTTPLNTFNQTQLAAVQDLVLEKLGIGKITFTSPVDLRGVVDLNNLVLIESNLVGIDRSRLPALNVPATVTIQGVSANKPIVLFNDKFTDNRSQVTTVCPSSRCAAVASSGPITKFVAANFGTFSVGDSAGNALSVPSSLTAGGLSVTRGSSVTDNFTITNTGSLDITDLSISSTAASKYGVVFSVNGGAFSSSPSNVIIKAGGKANVSVRLSVPSDEDTGVHNIGDIVYSSTFQSGTSKLLIDPDSGLSVTRVKVEGDTVSQGGDAEIKPDEDITIKVEVKNLLSVKIEDIEIEVTLEDIDNDDDIDEKSDDFNLDPGEDEEESLDFKIPDELEDDEYDVTIVVDGKDASGGKHKEIFTFKLEVDKDKHDLRLNSELSVDNVECARRPSIIAEVKNLGRDDEDDVKITVSAPSLGIEKSSREVDVDKNDELNVDLTLNLEDAEAGLHQITVSAFRDSDNKEDEETHILTVKDCATTNTDQSRTPQLSEIDRIRQLHQQLLAAQLPPPTPTVTVAPPKSGGNGLLIALLVSLVFVIVVGGIMGVMVYNQKPPGGDII